MVVEALVSADAHQGKLLVSPDVELGRTDQGGCKSEASVDAAEKDTYEHTVVYRGPTRARGAAVETSRVL